MAKPAYVFMQISDGTIIKTHSTDIGGTGGPTNYASDLENLIAQGYIAKREVHLDGTGRVLLILERP